MLKYYWWRTKLYLRQKRGKKVKQIFEIGSPYTSFAAGKSYSYINQLYTYQSAYCKYVQSDIRVPEIEELRRLSYEIQTILMYTPLLVWAIETGNPVVAYVTYNKRIKTIPMHSFYKANVLCISSL